MWGLWGFGGDEVPCVGVDVVEVGVVVVLVVVGLVRRHLLYTEGESTHRLDIRLRGRPAPRPPPYALPALATPAPRPACPRGPTSPIPPLPSGPLSAP